MTEQPSIFSLWETPLLDKPSQDGRRGILIEASAGTGKTYSIENMVVRMMCDPDEPDWTPERLLVVTFTEAATAELCVRLKATLRRSVEALEKATVEGGHGVKSQSLIGSIVNGVPESRRAEQLRRALLKAKRSLHDFDRATIATIHSFCQKMLSQSPLTAVVGTRDEIAPDDAEYCRKALYTARKARLASDEPISQELHEALFGRHLSRGWMSLGKRLGVLAAFPELAEDALLKAPSMTNGLGDPLYLDETTTATGVCRVLLDARDRLYEAKRINGVRTYDDILREMRRAVDISAFAAAVRERYLCVLIDEFQDTDDIQYGIFKKLFMQNTGSVHRSLVFVGDPKQAIYGFRGADIDAYLQARGDVARLCRLPVNYRTHPTLIQALNTFFMPEKAEETTCDPESSQDMASLIGFSPVEASDVKLSGAGVVTVDGIRRPVLEFVKMKLPEDALQKPDLEIQDAAHAAILYVKADILRLLSSGRITDPKTGTERPIRRSDIAVLVRTNKQVALAQECFGTDIRTSAAKPVSIFCVKAAADLLMLLKAAVNPQNVRQLAWSAMTPLFGLTAGDLGVSSGNEATDEKALANILFCREMLRDFRRMLVEDGFTAALDRFERSVKLSERLLTRDRDSGREYLGVLRLLSGRLDAVWREAPSLDALASRFEELIAEAREKAEPDEADQVPNMYEGDVVTLQTMHKSKGLEYPIVYLPDVGGRLPSETISGIGREHLYRAMPDFALFWFGLGDVARLGVVSSEVLKGRFRHDFEEEMRLLYVAFTRAKSVVTAVLSPGADSPTPLSAFMTGKLRQQKLPANGFLALLDPNPDKPADPDTPYMRKLEALSVLPGVSIRSDWLPDEMPKALPEPPVAVSAAPALTSPVRQRISTTSFTNIATRTALSRLTVSDPHFGREDDEDGAAQEPEDLEEEGLEIKTRRFDHPYPAGPDAGDVLHKVIEATDFQTLGILPKFSGRAASPQSFAAGLLAAVCPWMNEDDVDAARTWTGDMLAKLTGIDFIGLNGEHFRLADVPFSGRRSEMNFLITLPEGLTAAKLNAALAGWSPEYAFADESQEFDLQGYLTGSIDLAFSAAGKWWLIDWKSNIITREKSSVTPEDILEEMRTHRYRLQYILYLVAFRRFLRERFVRSGMTTEEASETVSQTMGGVFYVFVRWLDGRTDNGMPPGIFRADTDERFLSKLEALMSGADPLTGRSAEEIRWEFARLSKGSFS